jgi:hypothetical protein
MRIFVMASIANFTVFVVCFPDTKNTTDFEENESSAR